MATTTVVATGSEWGYAELCDGWGPDTDDEKIAELVEEVRSEFEALCAAEGNPSVDWQPKLSEVHAECYGEDADKHSKWDSPYPDIDLDALRLQAIETVWTQFVES